MTNLGLTQGDVIVLMAPNHLDVCIPFYAALYLGVISAAVDQHLAISKCNDPLKCYGNKVLWK